MCDKAVNIYPSTIKFVPKCLLTKKMCDKVINTYFFAFDSVPDWIKTQAICDRVVYENLLLTVYCK